MAQYFGHPHRLKLLHFLHAEFRHLHQVSWAKVDGETVKPSTKLSWDYHLMFMGSIKNGVWMVFYNDFYNGSMMVLSWDWMRFSWENWWELMGFFKGIRARKWCHPTSTGSAPWALLLTSALGGGTWGLGGCSWGEFVDFFSIGSGVSLDIPTYGYLWVIKYPLMISTYFNCTPKIPQVYHSISILSSSLI